MAQKPIYKGATHSRSDILPCPTRHGLRQLLSMRDVIKTVLADRESTIIGLENYILGSGEIIELCIASEWMRCTAGHSPIRPIRAIHIQIPDHRI
ncbi:MAG: hypothetical protein GY755_06615 [Chloroflexi bacterium]|nr:hypothetical protein [Chloroflexota bacterium]